MMKVRAWMDRLYGYMPASWATHTVGITAAAITNAIARGQVRQERLTLPTGHVLQLVSIQDVAKIRPRKGRTLPPVSIPPAVHPQAAGAVLTAATLLDQGAAPAEDRQPAVFTKPKQPPGSPRNASKGRGVARSTPGVRKPQRGSNGKTPALGRKRAPNRGGIKRVSRGRPRPPSRSR